MSHKHSWVALERDLEWHENTFFCPLTSVNTDPCLVYVCRRVCAKCFVQAYRANRQEEWRTIKVPQCSVLCQ